jgi:hypothetical protein
VGAGIARLGLPMNNASSPTGCSLLQAVSKTGEADKCLYLRLKLVTVLPFHGFGGIGGVI